jgi:hypothetical protein
MQMTRRHAIQACAAAAAYAPLQASEGWTPEWDRLLLMGALEALDQQYDPAERMQVRQVGGAYNYHSSLRNVRAHPTRESLRYALLLLEAGGANRRDRAFQVMERTIALQETDPESRWYGIWGYYLEEPAPKMTPADWNWADFNGSTLLMIESRHGGAVPGPLRQKVAESIHHAAQSVRRRNVAMTYTNIAVQGTFVTMAAAELLKDRELLAYSEDRIRRFASTVDETGSFAEYNSPTYAKVTIENLTRMRMIIRSSEFLDLVNRIHGRAWLHLAAHWHAPTRQLAGPMSRCYSTDIGSPLWLQKALGNQLSFVALDQLRADAPAGEGDTAVYTYECPARHVESFLDLGGTRQHREMFLPAKPPITPLQGTTYLDSAFTLGSANRGDFWIQRRPLLAYWGGPERPAKSIRLRVVKDDYDFSSGLLYSVQERNCVLGLINFRSPGGDKHVSLDPIQDGRFQARQIVARLDLTGVPADGTLLLDGAQLQGWSHQIKGLRPVAVDLGGAVLWFHPFASRFGKEATRMRIFEEEGTLAIAVDLLPAQEATWIAWKAARQAYIGFSLAMAPGGDLKRFAAACAKNAPKLDGGSERAKLSWVSPEGLLSLTGNLEVAEIATQDRAYSAQVGGKAVPLVRLSEERLV